MQPIDIIISGDSSKYQFRYQRGLTLLELLIGSFVGLIVISGLISYMYTSATTYHVISSLTEVQNSGQIAIDFLRKAHRRAGYLASFAKGAEMSQEMDGVFDIHIEGQSKDVDKCKPASDDWIRYLTQPVYGFNNPTLTNVDDCVGTTAFLGSDVATVRYVSNQSVNPLSAPNRYYFRGSLRFARIFKGSDLAAATPPPPFPETPYSTHNIVAESFFIAEGIAECSGQKVPTLFKITQGDAGLPVAQEIVPGIEKFEIQYQTKLRPGFANADTLTSADWRNIIAVRIWVLARSHCKLPQSESELEATVFSMADREYKVKSDATYALPSGYLRQLFVTTVWTRNLNLSDE